MLPMFLIFWLPTTTTHLSANSSTSKLSLHDPSKLTKGSLIPFSMDLWILKVSLRKSLLEFPSILLVFLDNKILLSIHSHIISYDHNRPFSRMLRTYTSWILFYNYFFLWHFFYDVFFCFLTFLLWKSFYLIVTAVWRLCYKTK